MSQGTRDSKVIAPTAAEPACFRGPESFNITTCGKSTNETHEHLAAAEYGSVLAGPAPYDRMRTGLIDRGSGDEGGAPRTAVGQYAGPNLTRFVVDERVHSRIAARSQERDGQEASARNRKGPENKPR